MAQRPGKEVYQVMNKQEKTLVLNSIHNLNNELTTRLLPIVTTGCKFGLSKGKMGHGEYTISRLRELADALETYHSAEFTLDDMQDYDE